MKNRLNSCGQLISLVMVVTLTGWVTPATGITHNEVEYQMVTTREAGPYPVLETSVFYSGETFRFWLKPGSNCYVYLLNHGSSGKYHILFPLPQINGGSNFVPANQEMEFPPKGSYKLDEKPGEESLIWCVSPKPIAELEGLIKSGFTDNATTQKVLARLEQATWKCANFTKIMEKGKICVSRKDQNPETTLFSRMILPHHSRQTPITIPVQGINHPNFQKPATQPGPTKEHPQPNAVSLFTALMKKMVEVRSSGSGLSCVQIGVNRLSKEGFRLVIPAGTYFVNQGHGQNMIAVAPVNVDLTAGKKATVSVKAVCANFDREQPDAGSSFNAEELTDPCLHRLLKVIDKRNPPHQVTQVAVWVLTNNITRNELNQIYRITRYINGLPVSSGPGVTEKDIESASGLLKEAGMDTNHFNLFR
ncbi:MAG: DUF4384 domain-containing protein [Phycisphaerae bacterium]